MQYQLRYLHQNLAALLAINPNIWSQRSQLINAIKIHNPDSKYFGIDTKVLTGSALRGGYCQRSKYFHFIIAISDLHYGLIQYSL